jgi:hypothetical protein
MKDKKKKQQKRDPDVRKPSDFSDHLRYFARNYDFLILFVVIFFLYNTVTSLNWSGDVVPAEFLPVALIRYQTVFFDPIQMIPFDNPNLVYAFPLVNGHHVSAFPIVTPVLMTPIYFISCIPLIIFNIPLDDSLIVSMAKTSAAIIAALSCVFVYLAAKELFSRKSALITVLIYAFATSTWSVSSQAPWQHGTVELLLILMMYLVIRNEREPSRKNIIFLGLLTGLFLFNRPPDAILLLPILGYIIWYKRENLPVYVISAAAAGLPFLVYNLSVFGNILGWYGNFVNRFIFSIDRIGNVAGLLVAPSVGLLVFCPVLILSVFGYLKLNSISNDRIRQVLTVFGPVIVLEILMYSFFDEWYGIAAYSYGQRYLTGFIPVLTIFAGIVVNDVFTAWPKNSRTRVVQAVIVLLVVLSVFIQAIGVFLYPVNPDKSMPYERTWDWNRSIVIESFRYGISHIDSITMNTFPPLPPLFHYQFGPGKT